MKGMDEGNAKQAFLMLDHVLGEYGVETKVAGITVLPYPEKPGDDVKPLATLAAAVDLL